MVFRPLFYSNLVVITLVVIAGVFVSHRIAGPIYRIKRSIRMLISGEFNFVVTLRKSDEFKGLAREMNDLINFLRSNIEDLRISSSRIDATVEEIHTKLSEREPDVNYVCDRVEELQHFIRGRDGAFSTCRRS